MAFPKKGVNPTTGGLSRASLEALDPETRKKYNDDGLLLDGSVDNSPLDQIYGQENQNQQANTPSSEPSIPLSQVEAMLEKMLSEKLANQPKVQEQKATPQTKLESIDELPGFADWEVKDRMYILSDKSKPISRGIRNRHKKNSPLMYYNPISRTNHALRYSSSQPSFLVDKQSGQVLVTYIEMKEGMLLVPKENVTLQKFLAIHPDNGKVFVELDQKAESQKILDRDEITFQAQKTAREISFSHQSAIARLMCFGFNDSWDSATIKLELFSEVKKSPEKFLKLANDSSLLMKGIIKTAQAQGYISYGNYRWTENDKGEVLIQVQPDANEVDALADYFNSNKGANYYQWLEQKVK